MLTINFTDGSETYNNNDALLISFSSRKIKRMLDNNKEKIIKLNTRKITKKKFNCWLDTLKKYISTDKASLSPINSFLEGFNYKVKLYVNIMKYFDIDMFTFFLPVMRKLYGDDFICKITVMNGNLDALKYLHKNNFKFAQWMLLWCSFYGNDKCLEYLIKIFGKIDNDMWKYLWKIVFSESIDVDGITYTINEPIGNKRKIECAEILWYHCDKNKNHIPNVNDILKNDVMFMFMLAHNAPIEWLDFYTINTVLCSNKEKIINMYLMTDYKCDWKLIMNIVLSSQQKILILACKRGAEINVDDNIIKNVIEKYFFKYLQEIPVNISEKNIAQCILYLYKHKSNWAIELVKNYEKYMNDTPRSIKLSKEIEKII